MAPYGHQDVVPFLLHRKYSVNGIGRGDEDFDGAGERNHPCVDVLRIHIYCCCLVTFLVLYVLGE